MALLPMTDVANNIKCAFACAGDSSGAPLLVTAGGTGDATEVYGSGINRLGSSGSMATSAVLVITWKAALTNTKTLSFAVNIKDSADNSTFSDATALLATTVVQTATSSTNFSGIYEVTVDLSGYKQYVKFGVTPDLNATGTDVALWSATLIMGGYKVSKDAV